MDDIEEYEASYEAAEEPAEDEATAPEENAADVSVESSPENDKVLAELHDMLHYATTVIETIKTESETAYRERTQLEACRAELKTVTAALAEETAALQQVRAELCHNMETDCKALFAIAAKNYERMGLDAQQWQKKYLKTQVPQLNAIQISAYLIQILFIIDMFLHFYYR